MLKLRGHLGAVMAAALLTAFGSDSTTSMVAASTAHGTLAENPPLRIASLNAASLAAQLSATRQERNCCRSPARRAAAWISTTSNSGPSARPVRLPNPPAR